MDEQYSTALARLDRLEGFLGPGVANNLYDRTPVWASVDGHAVASWAYLIDADRAGAKTIHTGDFNDQDMIFPALPTRLMSFGFTNDLNPTGKEN